MCTWQLRGTPDIMVKRHFFCTADHANAEFELPASIKAYLDSEEAAHATLQSMSIPMHTTVRTYMDKYACMGSLKYVMCLDTERRPGQQINVLANDALLYVEIQRYGANAIILFEVSEYEAQCFSPFPIFADLPAMEIDPLFWNDSQPQPMDDDDDEPFWLEDGHSEKEIREWLSVRGATGRNLLERGTAGPRTATQQNVIVSLATEPEVNLLLAAGYSTALICNYVLRSNQMAVILYCDEELQKAICTELSDAYVHSTERFVALMISYHNGVDLPQPVYAEKRPVYSGKRPVSPAMRMMAYAAAAAAKDDEEESYDPYEHAEGIPQKEPRSRFDEDEEEEVEVVTKKAKAPRRLPTRYRTKTVELAAEDIRTRFIFPIKFSLGLVSMVKKQGINNAPLKLERASSVNVHFVCVPLQLAQAEEVDDQYLTRTCYMRLRLAMVDCGKLASNRDAVFDYLSLHYNNADFVDRLNNVLRTGLIE